jgi:hypothetical protein
MGFLGNQFPLTPALSPREREQAGPVLELSSIARFVDRLTTILPLLGERAGVRGNATLEMQQVPLFTLVLSIDILHFSALNVSVEFLFPLRLRPFGSG